MKTQLLIYDDNCPLCAWYTGIFVKYGFLQANERKPFSTIPDDILKSIDLNKAKEEIPLLDIDSGKVLYGIDAMVAILSRKLHFIKSVTACKPVNWCLRRLYRFISYNRKVIVARKCAHGAIDCAPGYNYFYRLLFLIFFLLFNTLMLYPIHTSLLLNLPAYHKSFAELETAHFVLVAINCLLATMLPLEKAFEYIGQVNMLALLTVLLLLAFIPVVAFFNIPAAVIIGYCMALTVFIIKEYLRRMDYAGIIQHNRWIAAFNITSISLVLFYIIG